MIKVIYFGNLAQKTRTKEDTFEAKSLNQLLGKIKTKYGKEIYKDAKTSHIIINEDNAAFVGGFASKLQDGDSIKFLPICAGG